MMKTSRRSLKRQRSRSYGIHTYIHTYIHTIQYNTHTHVDIYIQAMEALRSEHDEKIAAVTAEANIEMDQRQEEHKKALKALK